MNLEHNAETTISELDVWYGMRYSHNNAKYQLGNWNYADEITLILIVASIDSIYWDVANTSQNCKIKQQIKSLM